MEHGRFEEVARRYADGIYRVACHALRDPVEAEDVTQTVLLRLYQHNGAFESEEHQRYWIFRVAVNESRKVLRSPWRKKVLPLEVWDGTTEATSEDGGILGEVMRLDEKYRLPIYLYYYEECSVKEIAYILHLTPSTVQTRLQRARDKLKIMLQEDFKEDKEYV